MAFFAMLLIFILGLFLGFSVGLLVEFDWQAFWNYKYKTKKMTEEKGNETFGENN